MFIIGVLASLLLVGLYSGFVLAAAVFAVGATIRFRTVVGLTCWGLVAWLVTAPILLAILYVPMHFNHRLFSPTTTPFEKPRLIENFTLAALLAYGITSVVFLLPLVCAIRLPPRLIARPI